MPLTNILKKRLTKEEPIQCGSSRWAALGMILSRASLILVVLSADVSAFDLGLNPQVFKSWGPTAMQRILDSGASIIRVGRHGNLAKENAAIQWAGNHGIDVLLMCGYSRGIPSFLTDPTAFQKYADMCLEDIQTLDKSKAIKYVEVWNEWSGGLGLPCNYGQPPCNSGAVYTDLLCKVYDTVTRARSDIMIVGGALPGMDLKFIGKMLDAGAASCMHKFSWHNYMYTRSQPCQVDYHAAPSVGAAKFSECVAKIDALFRQKTGASMQMIISEGGRTDYDIVSERQRSAEALTALYKAARDNPLVDGYFWYTLPRTGKSADHLGHGMFDAAGNPKPTFTAFQGL